MSASPPPSSSLADLRKDYGQSRLDEAGARPDPFAQFDAWLQQALDACVPEASAMTLATVGSDLRPSTRIVLLKGLDARGLVWYGNHQSRKGRQLAGNPWAALQFHWVELERVVRVEGQVTQVSSEESDHYFHSRPLASRIGAWASAQSRPVASRAALEAQFAQASARFGSQPPRPPHWGGWRLSPDRWEFWQGRPGRLHDRLRYSKDGGKDGSAWHIERLAP